MVVTITAFIKTIFAQLREKENMTHRYGRIPKTRYAATLRGVTTYQSKVPEGGMEPRPNGYPQQPAYPEEYPHPMEPEGLTHTGRTSLMKLGYCYLPEKHVLIAKGRPAIGFVKYVGKKGKYAVVFVPGKGQFAVPFCTGMPQKPAYPEEYPHPMEPRPKGYPQQPAYPEEYPHPMEPEGPKGTHTGGTSLMKLGYCYHPKKHVLIAKGRPAIGFVKYVGKKGKYAVVFVPGKGQFVVPFCKGFASPHHKAEPDQPHNPKQSLSRKRRRYAAVRGSKSSRAKCPKDMVWDEEKGVCIFVHPKL